MQRIWLILTVIALFGCANDPESTESSPEKRGRFSDPGFLCDPANIALWDGLRDEGTDLTSYGLVCDKGGGSSIVVRDSLVPAAGNGEENDSENSADATAGSDIPDPVEDEMPPEDEEVPSDDPPPALDVEDPPAVVAVTYTADLKVLIDGDCIGCHSAGGSAPRLDGYANASAAGAASLAEIQNNAMPIGNPWSPADKALFLEWSNAGFPE